MLPFTLDRKGPLNLLFLGAHCDDIEIGCGGTVLRMANELDIKHVQWIVFTSTAERRAEADRCAEIFLQNVKSKSIIIKDFKDSVLPQQRVEVKNYFEALKATYQPDVIFTHYRHDLHQDHRLINELTWNTFRDHLILEYEIQKYDGDIGNPCFFVPVGEDTAGQKVRAILKCFVSQSTKHWFDRETFLALMRIRGVESATRYAEAFYLRKAILS
ncbi:MAG TPA: PIG-L deacetylase family protein [Chryseosolibacter sp.]